LDAETRTIAVIHHSHFGGTDGKRNWIYRMKSKSEKFCCLYYLRKSLTLDFLPIKVYHNYEKIRFFYFAIHAAFQLRQIKKVVIPEKPLGWQKIETPTTASLRGLSPLTEQIAWASGSGGTWLRTLDGGETWESGIIDGLDSVDFRDIEGIDANTAIAMASGQPAVIYKTIDGGKTWTEKISGTRTGISGWDGIFQKFRLCHRRCGG
jgi:hypothetical protein